jgi:hypothetical protein
LCCGRCIRPLGSTCIGCFTILRGIIRD